MVLDHIGLGVSDYERSKAFYTAALAPLGIAPVMEITPDRSERGVPVCGFGKAGKGEFWITGDGRTTPRLHVAFLARNRAEVRAFHDAALAAGARDHGAPGPRPIYHPSYYGAFVLDPDGHNVEAVCHTPE